MPSAKTIVWDIDDVLNDLTKEWLEKQWLPGHPGCSIKYHELTENPPHSLLHVPKAEYLASLDRFRLSPEADSMKPDEAVIEWFSLHGERYRNIAMTARPRNTVLPAIKWVMVHFGQWFQSFSYVPSERPGQAYGQPDRTKRDYLDWLGKADYFIDDNEENCLAAEGLGIRTFLVSQPWNKSTRSLMGILMQIAEDGRT